MQQPKITILSPEESLEYWNQVREENKALTPIEIIQWCKSLPKEGTTLYIIGEENWQKFYEWVVTQEGVDQWQIDLDLLTYLENWWNKNKPYEGYDRV